MKLWELARLLSVDLSVRIYNTRDNESHFTISDEILWNNSPIKAWGFYEVQEVYTYVRQFENNENESVLVIKVG